MEGPVAAPPAQTDQAAADSAPAVPPPRRKLKRSTRIGLIIILILALVAAGGFGTSYFLNARNYVSTDNAQVDGSKISINAPTTATLTDWPLRQGRRVQQAKAVGRLETQDGPAQPPGGARAHSG